MGNEELDVNTRAYSFEVRLLFVSSIISRSSDVSHAQESLPRLDIKRKRVLSPGSLITLDTEQS